MKFHLNAIVATLVVVTSISAQAALSLPNTGNGSLMLVAIDRTANVSALFDLGLTYGDLNLAASSGPIGASAFQSIRWDIAANTDYSAAWAQLFANGATSTNLQYAVIAADNLGTGEGTQGYISTYAAQGSTFLTAPLITAVGNFNNYIVNTTHTSSPTLVNSFPTTTSNGALAIRSVDNIFVNGKLNNSGNFIFGAIDSYLGIQQVVSGRLSVAPVKQVTYPYPVFTLTSAGELYHYRALSVPESETYAMLLAGLGLMGFVSRRKQA